VLHRDLAREEEKMKIIETPKENVSNMSSPVSTRIPLPSDVGPTPASSPPTKTSSLAPRRQSTISLSSLNRPAPSLRLDLSDLPPASLRMEEASSLFSSGLRSPATLAPKSARPVDHIVEWITPIPSSSSTDKPVDIDLTLPETGPQLDELGNTADRPLDVDLMGDLFGDNLEANGDMSAGLFSPVAADTLSKGDDDFLQVLGVTDQSDDNMFTSLTTAEIAAPTMLADFAASSGLLPDLGHAASANDSTSFPAEHEGFDLSMSDIDLGFLHSGNQGSEMPVDTSGFNDMDHLFAPQNNDQNVNSNE
jgi:hypothetical protein